MTVQDAIEIRDRAIALGLKDCCDECSHAIETLDKLGSTGSWGFSDGQREPTLGLGTEEAARYLRRQIGAKTA